MKSKLRRGLVLGLLTCVVVIGVVLFLRSGRPEPASFRTVPVQRGDVQATISATGTVEPEEVVDVGAQVAGIILTFGKDANGRTVDYGSTVEKGMILARIDDSLYEADVAQAKAQLQQGRAGVQRAEADLGSLKAKLVQAERDWARAKKLGPSDALSQADYDAALSAFDSAKANLAVGEAAIVQARETVSQAQATLNRAQRNLDYCTIRSPVRGVIIDRRVNIGQTVVSSLNAPSLFLIAKDLTRMQVWVAVNEADVGNIRPGQPVTFTVDAYPGQVFRGEVGKVRLNAAMTQNVVNYTVEVITENADGKLLPYLTANVKFMLNASRNVLLVPNAALRWTPQPDRIAATEAQGGKHALQSGETDRSGFTRGNLWVPEGEMVRQVPVRVGVTDGTMTEVQGNDIGEETLVVVGEIRKENGNSQSVVSPFTPKLPKPKGGPPPR